MSDLPRLLDANRAFAGTFDGGDLPIRPRLRSVVLTCLDSRVDPAHFFGLGLGDALVMRNAGGRLSHAVLRDLAVLRALITGLAGGQPPPPLELVIVHHTDCGLARFADPAAQEALAAQLGIEPEEVATTIAITDPATSVRDDIARLRDAPDAPDALVVSGLVYDVANGTVEQVVAPAPLRGA